MLPKRSAYGRDIDETKYMYFLIKDGKLLENIIKFRKKSEVASKKDSIVNLYTMKKIKYLLKTKIKSYEGKINTNFYSDKIPEEGSKNVNVFAYHYS